MLRLTLFVFALTHGMCASAAPDQVIVVRHAERATEPRADPSITREGAERAELLARMLAAANVQTIVTTNFRRTQETADPLARRMGVTPVSVAMQRDELQAHVDEVVDRARRATGVVLVVGHSNTVASIVQALSSSSPTRLCETSFSNIFIVTPAAPLLPAVQLKYGDPDAAPAPDCQ